MKNETRTRGVLGGERRAALTENQDHSHEIGDKVNQCRCASGFGDGRASHRKVIMPTVTFILGLCGSGKTWLAERIIADRTFDEGFICDKTQHVALIDALRSGGDCVVVEIHYCRQSDRNTIVAELRAAVPEVRINWLCIENDLSRANKNCRERTNKVSDPDGEKHVGINGRLSPGYSYPDGGGVLKMWTKSD